MVEKRIVLLYREQQQQEQQLQLQWRQHPEEPKDVPSIFDGVTLCYILNQYIKLVVDHFHSLPAIKELTMAACCKFGVRPNSPAKQKEFVTELMLRHQADAPQSRAAPHGPVGTEWCIVNKQWWDAWRLYVGHKRVSPSVNPQSLQEQHALADGKLVIHSSVSNLLPFPSSSSSSSSATPQATVSASGVQTHTEPPEPGAIDNWAILRKTGAKQLLQGTMLGQHVETVPPSVYAAVRSWYSGGPRILRKVRSFVWFFNARLLTGRCIVIIVLQPAIVRASSTKKRCYLL